MLNVKIALNSAGIRLKRVKQNIDKSRLARSVPAKQNIHAPGSQRQVKTAQNPLIPERFAQTFNLNKVHIFLFSAIIAVRH